MSALANSKWRLYDDEHSRSLTVIDENHRMIHAGFYFELWRGDTTLADATNLDILLSVPAGTFPHLQDLSLDADGSVQLEMYETTLVSANGTALPVFNKNRNSSNTPNTNLYYAPTITGIGTQIKHASIVASGTQTIFSQNIGGEWLLKPSTNYLVRVANASGENRNINLTVGFYEIDWE